MRSSAIRSGRGPLAEMRFLQALIRSFDNEGRLQETDTEFRLLLLYIDRADAMSQLREYGQCSAVVFESSTVLLSREKATINVEWFGEWEGVDFIRISIRKEKNIRPLLNIPYTEKVIPEEDVPTRDNYA